MTELWYTLGPASLGKEREALARGATGVRLTFSYGTFVLQDERAANLRAVAAAMGLPCRIIADLAGGKFRLGSFEGAPTVPVPSRARFRMIKGKASRPATDGILPVPDGTFFAQLQEGSRITVGDGGAILEVVRLSNGEALAETVGEGTLDQNRGLVIQGRDFQPLSLTPQDLDALEHIATSRLYDAVALSFVASSDDVRRARVVLARHGHNLPVVAKIETATGVVALQEICASADMVMAARGDLALALPWVELPSAVESIAAAALGAGKPWLLATQVVEGLERFLIPTRAEICDLVHWLERGCHGVLLSYETAFGSRPMLAVACTRTLLDRWQPREVHSRR